MRRLLPGIKTRLTVVLLCLDFSLTLSAEDTEYLENLPVVRPSEGGALQIREVDGRNQLCDSSGNPVQLRGMSTHGLQWYPQIVNDNAFRALSLDWGSNVVRLAMYVTENGYGVNPGVRKQVVSGIRLAMKHDMYVIVDWHVLSPGDPSADEYAGAMDFFRDLSREFPNNPYILYELCNEPNGNEPGVANDEEGWKTVKQYAEPIISMLRSEGNNNIVIVGNPNWSQRPDLCAQNPIQDRNTMYAFHFYSGTHKEYEYVWNKVESALEAGIPLFCTEWGTSRASGDGGPFLKEADPWIRFMNRNGISWCNWSLTNKNESSGAFVPYKNGISEPTSLDPGRGNVWPAEKLSVSGEYVRARIKGVSYNPVERPEEVEIVHAEEGYPEIPCTFEDGTRQGWAWFANSGVQSRLSVETVRNSQALSWYVEYADIDLQDTWADAPRLLCSNIGLYREDNRYVVFDFYLEPQRVSRGELSLILAMAPPSLGYWAQAAKPVPVVFAGDNALELGKDGMYHVRAVFDLEDLRDGKELGPEDLIRDLTIVVVNNGSDFAGRMYLDNVELLESAE